MMTLAMVLLLIGVALLIAEMVTPGVGLFMVAGLISVIVSAVIMVIYVPFGTFIVMGMAVVLSVMFYAIFKYLKRKQLYGKLILNETLDFENDSIADLDYFIGKEGITKTTLKPVGTADFNGVCVDVTSNGSFIEKGQPVKVVEVRNQTIIVKQNNSN